ncbi:MAG: hypothetical protein IJ366_05950 [Clostridia bacterium]|nr:hypothetical protein [Clostridia bacterium]
MDISKIDKNFNNYYSYEGMTTHNVNSEPFKLYGLCRQDGESDFKRIPESLAKKVNNNSIALLYKNTSGIRVRFKTTSRRIILKCILPEIAKSPHMPLTGSSCFDLYADGRYCNVFRPGIDINGGYSDNVMGEDGYHSGFTFSDRKMRDILIHFPLYNDVSEVYIALEEGCELCPPDEYKTSAPVIFYGSSITQGGCASHAGNCYPAIISRRLDCDYINLGFSGGCLAETEMAEYISGMDKSVLVYDYDHNAQTADYLANTHGRFFKEIRNANPTLPVIIISAADLAFGEKVREERKNVIYQTYKNALAVGDRNVYFVDGAEIYKDVGADLCTVDNTHPNDLGFWCMANAIGRVVEKILLRRMNDV